MKKMQKLNGTAPPRFLSLDLTVTAQPTVFNSSGRKYANEMHEPGALNFK